jgi:hypothetical protein
MCLCAYIYMYICVYICVYIYMCVYVCVHIYIYIYIYLHWCRESVFETVIRWQIGQRTNCVSIPGWIKRLLQIVKNNPGTFRFIFNACRGCFSRGKRNQSVNMDYHIQLEPSSFICTSTDAFFACRRRSLCFPWIFSFVYLFTCIYLAYAEGRWGCSFVNVDINVTVTKIII